MASSSPVPHLHLLCMMPQEGRAFQQAADSCGLPASVTTSMHRCFMSMLPAEVKFDLVVSPANSYGRLDGSFDDAISKAFAPRDDYHALTAVAQRILYDRWRGFAPPGTATLVRIPDAFEARSNNVWGAKYVALCPTMRTPDNVRWDREVVYECVWSLLCAVDQHNRAIEEGKGPEDGVKIKTLLMTPLATGCGMVTPQRWAEQAVLAIKHFVQAVENPERWSNMQWLDIQQDAAEVEKTWAMGN